MKRVRTIGIVGGGQLGRMLTLAAKPLGFDVVVLEANKDCPAAQVGAKVIFGDLYSSESLEELASQVDVVTVEIEHMNADALIKIAKSGKAVHPSPSTIKLIQDKYLQKVALQSEGIAVAPFIEVTDIASANTALKLFDGKMILKTKHGAYDGRGNAVVRSKTELRNAYKQLGKKQLYTEALIGFKKELSVLIARDVNGIVKLYDTVEMRHERNICLEVIAPAQITKTANINAQKLAEQVSLTLKGAGVFAVEMFLLEDDSVLVNEIAPRVHNSGHHTIEACVTSQFEQHIRAVSGLPLGETTLVKPAAAMVNILGTTNAEPELFLNKAVAIIDTHIHWYGKSPVKVDRKMGHITALNDTVEAASKNANNARKALQI